jgi:hypothetical protein
VTKYVVFGGGAGSGKSWLICEWLLVKAIAYPGTRLFVARNELTRLMSSTFVTFAKVAKFHGFKDWKLNGQYHYVELGNGSRIDLLDVKSNPSDPFYERFGSTEYTGGALEEAGEIDFGAFDVLKSRVGRHMNKEYAIKPKILVTCNPKKNWLYQKVYKPWKEGGLPSDFAFVQALYSDNPHTAESYKEQLSSISDVTMKQRLMFGNWEYESDPRALIAYDAIADLFSNTVPKTKGERYMTVDVARYGSDRSVFALWDDFTCYRIITHEKTGLDYLADEIRRVLAEERIPYSRCLIDEDGVGGGVVDHVRGAKGFMANRAPFPNRYTGKPDNFNSLKAQCAYAFADFANSRKLAIRTDSEPIRQAIVEELEQIKAKEETMEGKLALESKDVTKTVLGRSPDIADALVMRMYFELESPTRSTTTIDPIAAMLASGFPGVGKSRLTGESYL